MENKDLVTEIDYVLEDLCKMDVVAHFKKLVTLVLCQQGISLIEVLC